MIGLFAKQQERLAERIIRRQYQKQGVPVPNDVTISIQAAKMVADARQIVKTRGGNIWAILKETGKDIIEHSSRKR